jgi:hypothetical protein
MLLARYFLCALVLCTPALNAQPSDPPPDDLLSLTDRVRAAMAYGDWKTAAELSAALRNAVREERDRSLAVTNSDQISHVLTWLPDNTETLVVAQQPFTVVLKEQQSRTDAPTAARTYLLGMIGPFEELLKSVDGATIRYAVLAARKFANHPADSQGTLPLGMIAFEGCAVYGLANPVAESAFPQMPDLVIQGQPVWSVKQQLEGQARNAEPVYETNFAAEIKADVLLVCNDKDFFSSILSRISVVPRGSRFERLPEWKQVDRSAPVWGIRDFALANAETDPTHPANSPSEQSDAGAIGVAVQVGLPAGKVQMRWLSTGKGNIFEGSTDAGELKGAATMRRVFEGVWELTVSDEGEAGSYAVFVSMAMLGFAVYL